MGISKALFRMLPMLLLFVVTNEAHADGQINNYEIIVGADDPLCKAYVAHLESMPPRPEPPYRSCLPSSPRSSEFAAIDFEDLDPLEHMDLVKELGLTNEVILSAEEKDELNTCGGKPSCLDKMWEERDWLLGRATRNIESGIYVLRRAYLDINGDGQSEMVLLHRSVRLNRVVSPNGPLCEAWGSDGLSDPSLKLDVLRTMNNELTQRYRYAIHYGDVRLYNDQIYLIQSLGPKITLLYAGKEKGDYADNRSMACSIAPR